MMKTISFLFACLWLFSRAESENILILMGIPSPSHHIWLSTLANGLAQKSNHNVTVLSPNKDNNPPANVHYILLDNVYSDLYPKDPAVKKFNLTEMSDMTPFEEVDMFDDLCYTACEIMVRKKGIQDLLSYPTNFKFDMIILDFLCGPCLLFLAEKFNSAVIIEVTAFPIPPFMVNSVGGHNYYAYSPFYNLKYDALEMTFWQRLYNFMLHAYASWKRNSYAVPAQDKIVRETLNIEFPYLGDLEKRTVLALINTHPAVDLPLPLAPNVILVGGLQIKEPKPLPEDIENFINQSEKGAVLFSLGSNVKSDELGSDAQIKLLKAFAQMPQYNFLWKFETDTLSMRLPQNVMVKPWVPQNDLLGHPKIKLFITHAGGLSTMESSWFGVPMVGIPFYGDQHTNLYRAMQAGIAEKIDFSTITTEEVVRKVLLVLETPSYKNNIEIRSKRFRDQKELPLDRGLWWIDWVLRNPQPDHIQSPVLKIGHIQSYSYDIVAFLVVCALIASLIVLKVACFCLKSKRKSKQKTQ